MRELQFAVVCECGWARFYATHPSASAAQAGHAVGCKGPVTGIYTGHSTAVVC